MNYETIHDAIIRRAQDENRVYDSSIHHKHHIVPLHEDPLSVETVVLTHKEHRIVHLVRSKFVSRAGNYVAAIKLKSWTTPEVTTLLASMGGKRGGAQTRKNKNGIFSDTWDRSAEMRRRHEAGIMNTGPTPRRTAAAKANATKLMTEKRGIFAEDYDFSAASKKIWDNLSVEEHEKRSKRWAACAYSGGQASLAMKAGFHGLSDEQKSVNAALGGKAHLGKVWMHREAIRVRIPKENVDNYLADGWLIGMNRKKKVKVQ